MVKRSKNNLNTHISLGLWILLNRTQHAILKIRQKELNHLNITFQGSAVLTTIKDLGDEATISNLAKQLFLEYHSTREQVIRMEKKGLVKRRESSNINDGTIIELTSKGIEVYFLVRGRINSITNVMSGLNKKEQKQLWHLLYKLRLKAVDLLELKHYQPSPPDIEEYITQFEENSQI